MALITWEMPWTEFTGAYCARGLEFEPQRLRGFFGFPGV